MAVKEQLRGFCRAPEGSSLFQEKIFGAQTGVQGTDGSGLTSLSFSVSFGYIIVLGAFPNAPSLHGVVFQTKIFLHSFSPRNISILL